MAKKQPTAPNRTCKHCGHQALFCFKAWIVFPCSTSSRDGHCNRNVRKHAIPEAQATLNDTRDTLLRVGATSETQLCFAEPQRLAQLDIQSVASRT